MFEKVYYVVKRIDGDYAYLVREDEPSLGEKCVARALLPMDVYYGKNVPLFRRNGYRKPGAMIP